MVAFQGSTGTLSEIALALNNDKTVFIVEDSGGVCEKITSLLEDNEKAGLIKKTTLKKVADDVINTLTDPD